MPFHPCANSSLSQFIPEPILHEPIHPGVNSSTCQFSYQPPPPPMVRRSCSKDREVVATTGNGTGRKWYISSSMDYINKTGKGNYTVRSNPIGNSYQYLFKHNNFNICIQYLQDINTHRHCPCRVR